MKNRIICILGMHRSGTSCLAGTLQAAGLKLGPNASQWNSHNTRGNCENPGLQKFHDRLFEDSGGSWDEPPQEIRWTAEHERQARELIAEYAGIPQWGFKDPRTLITLDHWRRLLGPVQRVGIFRNPVAVTRSLQKRSAGTADKWLGLWICYNQRLLAEYDRESFPLLSFDWEETRFHKRIESLLPALGLGQLPPEKRFYTADLHHHRVEDATLSAETAALYGRLNQIAEMSC